MAVRDPGAPLRDPGAQPPDPGDLLLDVAVPECERVTLSRNGWSASATHVWTGTGWVRLLPGTVRRRTSEEDRPAVARAVPPGAPVPSSSPVEEVAPVPSSPPVPDAAPVEEVARVEETEEPAPSVQAPAAEVERPAPVRSMPARPQRQAPPRRTARRPAV